MFDRILIGTDGSQSAQHAIRVAGELARQHGVGQVHIVTACEPLSYVEMRRIGDQLPEEYRDMVDAHMPAKDRFQQADDILARLGIKAVHHERQGNAAKAILDIADEVAAELIVVGARGLNAVERMFRGSVSSRVVHHAKCSVLVVED